MNFIEACKESRETGKEFHVKTNQAGAKYKVIDNTIFYKNFQVPEWAKTSICSFTFICNEYEMVPIIKEGWINVYRQGKDIPRTQNIIHETESLAKDYICSTAGHVDTIKITWQE
jgi:hypothetical protein